MEARYEGGDAGNIKKAYRLHSIVKIAVRSLTCNLYSTQRPPSGCQSSGTVWHLLLLLNSGRFVLLFWLENTHRYGWADPCLIDTVSFWNSNQVWRKAHALLGVSLPGRGFDCGRVRLHRRRGRVSRYCENSVHRIPGAVSCLTRDPLWTWFGYSIVIASNKKPFLAEGFFIVEQLASYLLDVAF